MLTSLALRGVFSQVAAVVVGDTGGGGDHYMQPEALEPFVRGRVLELVGDRDIPVACGAPLGHRARNVALPFAVTGQLDCLAPEARLYPSVAVNV
jgi:muramoyltetrapeptide carboxypeptidase LdcA involved in peptidoglycan recycling